VTREFFENEMNRGIEVIEKFGVRRSDALYFIPPYEWYNAEISKWSGEMGLRLINFTPGTRSNADYTEDGARNFASSKAILDSIKHQDQKDGLNGFLLLMHLGVGPKRTDKMSDHIGELIDYLQARGYKLVRVDELLSVKP
jgi:peptidoglycan/xylan/chitin deacetylase (PgdA/CDA1 family)